MLRLISLYIKDYKNIHEQTFDFSTNSGYVALIGLNGSGKSNLLETMSLIFKGLLFDKKKIPFEYEITYEMDGSEYFRKSGHAKINGVTSPDSAMRYPSSVIACYSGEDSRLWKSAYEQFYMQYFKNAVSNVSYVPMLMYINKYSWKIAFISLLCSSKESVRKFLRENLGVADISNVTIHIDADASKRETFKDHMACRWYDRIKKLQDEDEKQELNANILASTDMMIYGATKPEDPARVFHFLYLLSMPEKNNPKGQTIDKLIKDISIKLGGIDFDSLSEGEKKMILIECITQVLADNNSLVLLDEPDAHVHIGNKKKILDAISQFDGQTILTTHSPVFVNEIYRKDKNVLFFMETGVLVKPDYINNLIALTSNEIDFLSGSIILSSKNILVTEGPYDKKYLEKAISALSATNKRYEKFEQIAIISSGSAGNSKAFYEQVLMPKISKYEKIVFIFDYDQAGYEGWKKIRELNNPKVTSVFYQTNYSSKLTDKPTAGADTIMVEDLFDPEAYKTKVESVQLDKKKTHKDFRCFNENIASAIKTYVENNYGKFKDEWYKDFKQVLDKLLDIYNL